MSLFQKSVEKKYLNELDSVLIDQKYKEFLSYFGNPSIQENIRNAKEEQFQEGFLRELFVSIFGYTLNPQPNFNLTTELKNIANSKKADGAILKGEDAIAVIELKGTDTTDLDKIETQAFGYKNHHPKCVYVITSNFEKLRFYIQNAVDHLDFDLFNLSREQFSIMWLCLAKDNLLNGLPQKIKESSLLQEENITKKLYADYSKFREAIYNNLVKNNSETDKLLLFKKTQKLLDRFLFIFFAEDRLLLPPNSISEIVKQWTTLKDELDEYVPLYDRFKKYFGYMNTGYKGKKYDIYAYNGGLFAPDEILDNIAIEDDILHEHTLKLSNYDFETDVDVNILGHIFEHSLGEIESVQAEIKGETVDNQKTKRKKDGIFYTPKYITKYIVKNTVGSLCNEKRTELDIVDEEYAKGRKNRKKDTIKALDVKLTDYRNWLLSLTILDPACGSGAFLNQALDFLIAEHRKIDDLRAQLFGSGLVFSDITTDILEKNIYGVDLNEESVEIAKLSLWLRTAQKGRKLNKLNNNIKCGNSLIDDSEIVGEKAFNWQNEFPEIFAKGGFDVVIGNPPYVRVQNISKTDLEFIEKKYCTATGKFDLYVLFNELSISLIKESGLICFIQPHRFITSDFGKGLRSFIQERKVLTQYISFTDIDIFEGATTYTGIFFLQKNSSKNVFYKEYRNVKPNQIAESLPLLEISDFEVVNYENNLQNWSFQGKHQYSIIQKLEKFSLLSEFTCNISQGVIPGSDKIYYLNVIEDKGDLLLVSNQLSNEPFLIESKIVKPIIKGNNVKRFCVPEWDFVIIYPYVLDDSGQKILSLSYLEQEFPYTFAYLKSHQKFLYDLRVKYKTNPEEWYGFHRARDIKFLSANKILTTHASIHPSFTVSGLDRFFNQNIYGIELKENLNIYYFLGVLNSKLIDFVIRNTSSMINGGYYLYKSDYLNKLPIVLKTNDSIVDLVKQSLDLNSKLQIHISDFINFMNSKFNIALSVNNFQEWYKLDFLDFIKVLKKLKIHLTLSEESEWLKYFNEQKDMLLNISMNIEKIDKELNKIVYELYGLSAEEIKIVEESI